MTDLNVLLGQHTLLLHQQYKELEELCAKHPDINQFVQAVLGEDSHDISQLVYEVSGYSLRPSYISWADTMHSFCVNYFLDDSYWTIQLTEHGCWNGTGERDDCKNTQNPLVLIEAARENREWCNKVDSAVQVSDDAPIFSLLKNKFESKSPILAEFTKNPKYVYPKSK